MKKILLTLLKIYKSAISPMLETYLGKSCKFRPTCSEYAHDAIDSHGVFKGTTLSVKRILRCNRFIISEVFDPVPKAASG